MRVIAAVTQAARAAGLWHGPVHAECRVRDDAVVVLEVAARPIGGLCARALRFDGAGGRGSVARGAAAAGRDRRVGSSAGGAGRGRPAC